MSNKSFPILQDKQSKAMNCPLSIPWDKIESHRDQAQRNHSQSLERLAERGGLSAFEAFLVMTDRNLFEIEYSWTSNKQAIEFLIDSVREESGQ